MNNRFRLLSRSVVAAAAIIPAFALANNAQAQDYGYNYYQPGYNYWNGGYNNYNYGYNNYNYRNSRNYR